MDPAREQKRVGMQLGVFDPGEHGFAGRHCDLKLDRALRLLLENNRAGGNAIGAADIANPQLHEVAGPQLAVDRKIEQGKISNFLLQLQANPDRPDVSEPERGLLAGELVLVPGHAGLSGCNCRIHGGSSRGGGTCNRARGRHVGADWRVTDRLAKTAAPTGNLLSRVRASSQSLLGILTQSDGWAGKPQLQNGSLPGSWLRGIEWVDVQVRDIWTICLYGPFWV